MHSLITRFYSPALLVTALFLLGTLSCCKKDDDPQPTTNDLTLHFEHEAPNGDHFALNTTYTNAAGNPYQISTLKYFVSNVKLTKADGTVWSEPDSYHLLSIVSGTGVTPDIDLTKVPVGDYTKVSYGIGVDSVANSRLDHAQQLGDLVQTSDMFWTWATGFKFLKVEGRQMTADAVKPVILVHTAQGCYRTVTLDLPEAATVRGNIRPEIHMAVAVDRLFGDAAQPPSVIDFGGVDYTSGHSGNNAAARKVSDNAAEMFEVEHVHNDPN